MGGNFIDCAPPKRRDTDEISESREQKFHELSVGSDNREA